jgi:lysophospholipase L1-like esterase
MRDRLAKLILLAAGVVASIGAAELVVRATGQGSSLWSLFAPHPELGWTFVPERRSGKPRLLSNRLGFRDVEHDVAKPAGTRRLVVLGDSFTAAAELRFDRIYPRVLQRLLDERSVEPWEVISLAVTGWGTAQEWLALERYGLGYAPDAVVLQFFPNDVCNNALAAADLCAFHDGMRPYLVERDGSWRVTWSEPLRRRLRLHSSLYRLVERGLEDLRLRWRSGGLGRVKAAEEARMARAEQAERLRSELAVGLHPFFYAYAADGDQIPPVAQGWSATERLIEAMARRLRAAGVPFALVVMPYEGAVDPAGWEAQWSGAARPPVPLVRDQPERRLEQLAGRLGIPALLLLERFERSREVVLPYRKYHLNSGGHRLAADAIYELLVEAGLVRGRGAEGPRPAPGHST